MSVLLESSSGHLLAELRSTSSAHIDAVVLKGQPGGTVICPMGLAFHISGYFRSWAEPFLILDSYNSLLHRGTAFLPIQGGTLLF